MSETGEWEGNRVNNRRAVRGLLTPLTAVRLTVRCYQVFVANPKKPPQIETILRRNKDKLLQFLKNFHNDKEGQYSRLITFRPCAYRSVFVYLKTSNLPYVTPVQRVF